MEQIDLKKLKDDVEGKVRASNLSTRVFLDQFRVIDESSRKTGAYNDSRYAPFYYYLGCLIQPKSMVEIGFRLGLLSGCFLKGCKEVENFLAFQEKTEIFYSPRMGRSNIKDVYKKTFDIYLGKLYDGGWLERFKKQTWDVIFINEEKNYDQHMDYLESTWPQVSYNGLVVMDYVSSHEPAKEAYLNFCKIKNRDSTLIDTRYGVGLVQK